MPVRSVARTTAPPASGTPGLGDAWLLGLASPRPLVPAYARESTITCLYLLQAICLATSLVAVTDADPYTTARELRAERAQLTERIKQLDEQGVAEGFARDMSAAEIATALGCAHSHVYAVRNRTQYGEGGQQ